MAGATSTARDVEYGRAQVDAPPQLKVLAVVLQILDVLGRREEVLAEFRSAEVGKRGQLFG